MNLREKVDEVILAIMHGHTSTALRVLHEIKASPVLPTTVRSCTILSDQTYYHIYDGNHWFYYAAYDEGKDCFWYQGNAFDAYDVTHVCVVSETDNALNASIQEAQS